MPDELDEREARAAVYWIDRLRSKADPKMNRPIESGFTHERPTGRGRLKTGELR